MLYVQVVRELKGFAGSNPVCSAFEQRCFTIMEFL